MDPFDRVTRAKGRCVYIDSIVSTKWLHACNITFKFGCTTLKESVLSLAPGSHSKHVSLQPVEWPRSRHDGCLEYLCIVWWSPRHRAVIASSTSFTTTDFQLQREQGRANAAFSVSLLSLLLLLFLASSFFLSLSPPSFDRVIVGRILLAVPPSLWHAYPDSRSTLCRILVVRSASFVSLVTRDWLASMSEKQSRRSRERQRFVPLFSFLFLNTGPCFGSRIVLVSGVAIDHTLAPIGVMI